MVSSTRIWLLVAALLAGLLMAACDGGDDNGDDNGDEPAATEPADDQDGDADDADDGDGDADGDGDDDVDAGGEAFADVPVPSGAEETGSGTFSASDLAFLAPGTDVDTEAFASIEFREYEVDDSPEDIIDFYKDELADWDEVFVFSGGAGDEEGGFGVWIQDDGRAGVWVVVSATNGTTDLMLAVATQE